jgi:hypothetical protein
MWKFWITFPMIPPEMKEAEVLPQVVKAFKHPKTGKLAFGMEARVPTDKVEEIKSRLGGAP